MTPKAPLRYSLRIRAIPPSFDMVAESGSGCAEPYELWCEGEVHMVLLGGSHRAPYGGLRELAV